MGKQKVTITDKSIQSGVTSDERKAICEFIWNGFDAKATQVKIVYTENKLGGITSLSIEDNGEGINRSSLHETFGRYQDSLKQSSFQWSSQVKGKKGKGRYAFNIFADSAMWTTIYKEGEKLIQHVISIDAGNNDHYNDHSGDEMNKIVHEGNTGTKVEFSNVSLPGCFFTSDDFLDYLKREFAVFLKLNEHKEYSIFINEERLDYEDIIAECDSRKISIKDETNKDTQYFFDITFIRWNCKIRENYLYYFLNENQIEKYQKTTKLNKKDTEFHHSVYITSEYFNHFVPSSQKEIDNTEIDGAQEQTLFGDKTEKDNVFKSLLKELKLLLEEKQKKFVSEIAGENLWSRFETNGTVVIPKNDYEYPLYLDLKNTVIGMYSVQPKIFTNIKEEQAKTLLGCLKLLLQTDKREDLLTILEDVVNMSDVERHKLVEILKSTELSSITNTIDLLENRFKSVSAIKAMLFDASLKAYEVDDVQKMISSCLWLFGEQYNVMTEAEPDFQQALEKYLAYLKDNVDGISKSAYAVSKIDHPDVNKEMDIFAVRQTQNGREMENLIIELKRPSVKLGEKELSQIKTYMRLIYSQAQFNSTKAKWTFILVGNSFDDSKSIENEINTNKSWGKQDLVMHVDNGDQNYEIYVKKWSSVFDDFEMRHNFLLKKLNLKREFLTAKYNNKRDLHEIVEKASER